MTPRPNGKTPSSLSSSPPPPPTTLTKTRTRATVTAVPGWSHTPSLLTLAWLAVSVPLVAWDTGYVLLRPLSMPGGSLHWPVWAPYALYGNVDHMYGFKQWNLNNGFTAAQSVLNVVESLAYVVYAALWVAHVRKTTAAAGGSAKAGGLTGRTGALAVLVLFAGVVMTLSKTALYWLNESFSGFDNIGHNEPLQLLFLWIIPNGLWLVFPAIITYTIGSEIVEGLVKASAPVSSRTIKGE
ncbi:hypothetical protein B0H67DRAFT_493511 [Lasiosphaeris hirsuta]|uniref:C6 transcription factor n=1 Tax=Lasiosphaeris hirsuta TaxID=260670 RepID=A0AA40AA06_9PEZI|nr:hypothetical protein B0H67DRAFT_493511 [Lasiosphaeris hirsuta]